MFAELKRAVVSVPKRWRARCSADRHKAGFEAFCGSQSQHWVD
jgi:hypothetical protein